MSSNGIDGVFKSGYKVELQNRGAKSSGITFELKSVFDDLVKKSIITDKGADGLTKEDAQNLYKVLNRMHQDTKCATNYTTMKEPPVNKSLNNETGIKDTSYKLADSIPSDAEVDQKTVDYDNESNTADTVDKLNEPKSGTAEAFNKLKNLKSDDTIELNGVKYTATQNYEETSMLTDENGGTYMVSSDVVGETVTITKTFSQGSYTKIGPNGTMVVNNKSREAGKFIGTVEITRNDGTVIKISSDKASEMLKVETTKPDGTTETSNMHVYNLGLSARYIR